MTVSVSLPLFLALTVLASVGLGFVIVAILDVALDEPDFYPPGFADDWWSEDDVTATVHEIREL